MKGDLMKGDLMKGDLKVNGLAMECDIVMSDTIKISSRCSGVGRIGPRSA